MVPELLQCPTADQVPKNQVDFNLNTKGVAKKNILRTYFPTLEELPDRGALGQTRHCSASDHRRIISAILTSLAGNDP
jgi:hypothetical protein